MVEPEKKEIQAAIDKINSVKEEVKKTPNEENISNLEKAGIEAIKLSVKIRDKTGDKAHSNIMLNNENSGLRLKLIGAAKEAFKDAGVTSELITERANKAKDDSKSATTLEEANQVLLLAKDSKMIAYELNYEDAKKPSDEAVRSSEDKVKTLNTESETKENGKQTKEEGSSAAGKKYFTETDGMEQLTEILSNMNNATTIQKLDEINDIFRNIVITSNGKETEGFVIHPVLESTIGKRYNEKKKELEEAENLNSTVLSREPSSSSNNSNTPEEKNDKVKFKIISADGEEKDAECSVSVKKGVSIGANAGGGKRTRRRRKKGKNQKGKTQKGGRRRR